MASHSSCRSLPNFPREAFHLGPRNRYCLIKQLICWYVVPGPSSTVSIPSCVLLYVCVVHPSLYVVHVNSLDLFVLHAPFTRYIWIRECSFTPSWLVDRSSPSRAIFMMWPLNFSGYHNHSFCHVILPVGPCAFGDQRVDRTMRRY